MDNLTHSLIGAALGQAGLKRKTGLAMPALIIAANLPDIDAPCAIYGVESLSMRRGITHGPIALLVLPLVLAGLLIAFDRWQARRTKRPEGRLPVHAGWLVALCYIGTFTHPLFDWFNNYGIRLLEPFSSQWFYGDTLFIVDPWIIAMLGFGVWRSLRRERKGAESWARPARLGIAGVLAFVAANIGISRFAADKASLSEPYPEITVANAVPAQFWRKQILWRSGDSYGAYGWSLFWSQKVLPETGQTNMSDPRIAEWAKNDPKAQAFLFWSRMPVAELHDDYIILRDQRIMDRRMDRQFSVTLRKPKP
ncbi:metal-dependent hydrolase [Novosphingobium sp. MW5]|nr:metal-dependent hydrolase [Novosphingobium sp. MW5]